MKDPRAIRSLALVALLFLARAASASDDALARARELYLAAAYDEAIAALDQMPVEEQSNSRREVREYRLFCLVALERKDEARSAIHDMLEADPLYHPSPERASPKVRTMFKEVRQAVLPDIVQRAYADAKTAFDRKDPGSTAAFERVLTLLNDPDLASRSTFADLRIVTEGFRDLSRAFARPPATPAAAPATAPASAATPPAPPPDPVVYREADPDVIAAVPMQQEVPPWTDRESQWERVGAIDIVIDENGRVISAVVSRSITARYDARLAKAALAWRYTPAHRHGQPVRVRKTVRVHLLPN